MIEKKDVKTFRMSLTNMPLFEGMDNESIVNLLQCLGARNKTYTKDEPIVLEGSAADFVGVVVEGKLQIIKEELEGSLTLIDEVTPGECLGKFLPVQVSKRCL